MTTPVEPGRAEQSQPARTGAERGQSRREQAEAAGGRRLRQVIDDRPLDQHRLAHRRVVGDESVVVQVMTEEARGGEIDLPERETRFDAVAHAVDHQADLRAGRLLPEHLGERIRIDERRRIQRRHQQHVPGELQRFDDVVRNARRRVEHEEVERRARLLDGAS